MKSIYLFASASAFALLLCGCAPELDQTGLSPEEQVWAENIKANYGAWEVPESVPRGVRRDDLTSAQSNDAATSETAAPAETAPAANEPAVAPMANEPAVAPVAPAAEAVAAPVAAPAAAESEVYTVAKGDTLGGIALKHYGKASAWKRILDANSDVLKGKTLIRPGMKLQIPRP